MSDPSIYIQWVENAISKQLINYFDYSEFSNHEKIGAGGFSTVVKAEWKSCELTVALKSIKFDTEWKEMKMLVKELQLLQRVSFHPKINHFYESNGNYKMVLQFANNGNLRDYLARKFSTLQWEDKFRIAREIAKGLEFIHANKIVHKDLHPKNILVHDDKMMIADFGLSKVLTVDIPGSNSNMEGMPAFIDPQCLKNSGYKRTTKSDIYSFGVILWEISSGHKPFPKLSRAQTAIKIFQDVRETPVGGTPPQYEQLYKQCWDVDPNKRPDIKEVLSLLTQLTIEPTVFRENIEKPLEGSLKKATLNHAIDSYNYNEFSEFTNIAEGLFSSVCKCIWKERGLTVALKCLKVDDKYLDENIVRGFIEMLKFLRKFNHTNIIKFYGITKNPSSGYYSMILPFADKGDLRDYLEKEFSKLDWNRKLCMAKEISEGLCYLHEKNITHGNLHSKNILVCGDKMIVAGFGISKQVDESFSASIAQGMSAYIDPQCFRDPNHKRDKKSDTYSLGVILWEISSGNPPFKSIDIGFSITIHVFNGGREASVEGTPPQYEQIYKQCWDDNPIMRPDIALVLGNLSQIIDA
ncbi:kinase-like domain-containing protein [Gigaspora rosea]|uniref:Kinase-like domain-containing protein n=1 Tax=Gigaspora rosea TaxID=44941 RepID=A0A397VTD8_9GLOM|nr:kinase-like domain-containing protein [Gigaspora rosea]